MAICSLASEAELTDALAALAPLPHVADIRPPEAGLVMLRGRIGGDGLPFNFGEASVARACVSVGSHGPMGFGYCLGRSLVKARNVAIIDALGQLPGWAERIETALTGPVSTRVAHEDGVQRAETAATRVNFFTLVRGED